MPAFDHRLYTRRLLHLCRERRITPAALAVGLALLEFVGRDSTCWPSHNTLSKRSGPAIRTVQRALDSLRDAGMLCWQARRARWNRRMSNLYTLLLPATLTAKVHAIRVPRALCPVARSRSVAQQLAALPVPDAAMLAMLSARSAMMFGRRQTR